MNYMSLQWLGGTKSYNKVLSKTTTADRLVLARPLLYTALLVNATASSSHAPSVGMKAHPQSAPQVSVIVSTYNRGELLHDALRSVLDQRAATTPPFELIVVDNNSTDNTREIVGRFAAVDDRVRYVFEPRQGSSYGRNAGIRESRAPFLAFTDDDVRAEADWVAAIVRAFEEHPDAAVVGGRVLPIWPAAPPAWLTRDHWSPLALIDYGDVTFAIDPADPICLLSANMAFRRPVLDVVGGFAPEFQLAKHRILGSVEDHELLLRVLRTGRTAFYEPRITVHAEIQPNRLERGYHRRWHTGHGHFHALLRTEQMERTRVGSLWGVPAHLYRQALRDAAGWVRAKAIGERERAFNHELRLRFFHGFFRTRRREFLETRRDERLSELWRRLPILRRREAVTHAAADGRIAGAK
jgi:glycosyltransferase involved in cell wall biosynthesis